jgi:outer membrane protein TolC
MQEVEGALGETVAKLHAARTTEALLQREALPQARATFQTVLANYGQGKGDLTAAIAAEHQVHEVDLRLLQTQLGEQTSLAAIERLIGGDL